MLLDHGLEHGDGPVVERGERLVEQQHFGIVQKRPPDRQALAHAARKLAGQAVAHAGETHALQHFIGALARIGQAVQSPEQRQIFDRRELVVERDAVSQNSDAPARGFLAGIGALNLDRPARGPGKSGDDPQQSGLAGSVAAQQGQGGSGLDAQSHCAEGRKVAVIFPDVGNLQRVHAAPLRKRSVPPSARIPKVRPSTQYILS